MIKLLSSLSISRTKSRRSKNPSSPITVRSEDSQELEQEERTRSCSNLLWNLLILVSGFLRFSSLFVLSLARLSFRNSTRFPSLLPTQTHSCPPPSSSSSESFPRLLNLRKTTLYRHRTLASSSSFPPSLNLLHPSLPVRLAFPFPLRRSSSSSIPLGIHRFQLPLQHTQSLLLLETKRLHLHSSSQLSQSRNPLVPTRHARIRV